MFDYKKYFSEQIYDTKTKGNYRIFRTIEKKVGEYPKVNCNSQKETLNFTGNDYLGLSTNQEVIDTMISVAKEMGVGSGGTRNISGTSKYHIALEKKVGQLHQKERGLVFSSAYLANVATLSVLGKFLPNCAIFSDALNHASIIEGISLSKAPKFIYKHNDMEELEKLLKENNHFETKVIVFESVYSMHGTIGRIKETIDLAKKYNALTLIDEVHAVGLYGDNGAGVAEQKGLMGELDLISGTFAKGFGCIGGYIAGKDPIVDYIRTMGAGFIFTTSMPPSIVAAIDKSIELAIENKNFRIHFFNNINYAKNILKENNITLIENLSHIICIPIGDSKKCLAISEYLLENYNVYVQSINYPTVEIGGELLRVTITPLHTVKHIEHFVESLKKSIQHFNLY